MPVLTSPAPTTELEAINTALGSIGEAPLADDFDLIPTDPADMPADVESAIRILRETLRETLTMGWRFNSNTNIPVAPIGTLVDSSGTLNVFQLPAWVLKWSRAPVHENRDYVPQLGISEVFQVAGEFVPVLRDATYNRDGPSADEVPTLYLDTVRSMRFELLPESARQYITIRAARRMAQRVPGSPTAAGFQDRDEWLAMHYLKKDQGLIRKANLFDNPNVAAMRGGREPTFRPLRYIRRPR